MHCDDKNKYFSEDEANEVATYESESKSIKLRSYHCHECGWWHLTKNTNAESFFRRNKWLPKKISKESFKDILSKLKGW